MLIDVINEIYIPGMNENDRELDQFPFSIKCVDEETGDIIQTFTAASEGKAEYYVQKEKFDRFNDVAEKYNWHLSPELSNPSKMKLTYDGLDKYHKEDLRKYAFIMEPSHDVVNSICLKTEEIEPLKDKFSSIEQLKEQFSFSKRECILGELDWPGLNDKKPLKISFDKDYKITIFDEKFQVNYCSDEHGSNINLSGMSKFD